MALSKRYYTLNGQLVGERATGGVRTDYLVDALGSVVGTSNKDNTVNRRYQYKPYGTRLSASGTGSDPRFQWVGAPGYRTTDRSHSTHYIRARHYAEEEGRWTTVDPLWPSQPALKYLVDPVGRRDQSGLGNLLKDIYDFIFPPPPRYDPIYGFPKPIRREPPCDPLTGVVPGRKPVAPIGPIYGTWCGPQFAPGGSVIGGPCGPDACCKDHDNCFAAFDCDMFNQGTRFECRMCTASLCACLGAASCEHAPSRTDCEFYRRIFMDLYACNPVFGFPLPPKPRTGCGGSTGGGSGGLDEGWPGVPPWPDSPNTPPPGKNVAPPGQPSRYV